ncbi:DNA-directed RNA polymerase subunit beta [Enterococcus timonensis]|uniref:DNA-directed RNA polymerase subunit beta n=1 Tax=Enterococcus timonensis TaxID=1852364 RepID=UPI0008DA3125|nr:DNA-directed RNA polymerase subunit beta [Enterococcus timonensis]
MSSDNVRYILVTIIKVLLLLVGMLLFFLVGAALGYGVFGDQQAMDVFDGAVWQHIFSFLQ